MMIMTMRMRLTITDGTHDENFETVAEAKVYETFNELVELNQVKMINFVSLSSAFGILENLSHLSFVKQLRSSFIFKNIAVPFHIQNIKVVFHFHYICWSSFLFHLPTGSVCRVCLL